MRFETGCLPGVLEEGGLVDSRHFAFRLELDPSDLEFLAGLFEMDFGGGLDAGGVATRALSNFEFKSLTADVNYTEDGDLFLGMRLEGVNPDLDPNQPVVLNLNLESNIPKMLRSMRATRSIEEIFQRRLNNQ